MSLAAITQAAHDQMKRHGEGDNDGDAEALLAALADGHDDTCTCQSCYPGWGRTHAPEEKP